jgi:Bacterial protein of unknown function (DUF899)
MTRRGVEAMDNSYRLLDLTICGRQEMWEDSPPAGHNGSKANRHFRIDGRPTARWSRLKAGYSDDLGAGRRRTARIISSTFRQTPRRGRIRLLDGVMAAPTRSVLTPFPSLDRPSYS